MSTASAVLVVSMKSEQLNSTSGHQTPDLANPSVESKESCPSDQSKPKSKLSIETHEAPTDLSESILAHDETKTEADLMTKEERKKPPDNDLKTEVDLQSAKKDNDKDTISCKNEYASVEPACLNDSVTPQTPEKMQNRPLPNRPNSAPNPPGPPLPPRDDTKRGSSKLAPAGSTPFLKPKRDRSNSKESKQMNEKTNNKPSSSEQHPADKKQPKADKSQDIKTTTKSKKTGKCQDVKATKKSKKKDTHESGQISDWNDPEPTSHNALGPTSSNGMYASIPERAADVSVSVLDGLTLDIDNKKYIESRVSQQNGNGEYAYATVDETPDKSCLLVGDEEYASADLPDGSNASEAEALYSISESCPSEYETVSERVADPTNSFYHTLDEKNSH